MKKYYVIFGFVYWTLWFHFASFCLQNQYRFEGTGFPTIPQLIEHHYTTKQVITKKSGVVLLNPVIKVKHCVAFHFNKLFCSQSVVICCATSEAITFFFFLGQYEAIKFFITEIQRVHCSFPLTCATTFDIKLMSCSAVLKSTWPADVKSCVCFDFSLAMKKKM